MKTVSVQHRRVHDAEQGDAVETVTTTVERHPAIIQWGDLLDACRLEPDRDHGAPWEGMDGWEHTVSAAPEEADVNECRRCFQRERDRWRIVTIDTTDAWKWFGDSPYHGASKGVVQEWFAEQLARAYDQIVNWRRDGWEWWGVVCSYLGEEDSLWGIDDPDYAQREVFPELADNVADQLEKTGYTVIGRPAPVTNREANINRHKHLVAYFNGFPNYNNYRAHLRKKVKLTP